VAVCEGLLGVCDGCELVRVNSGVMNFYVVFLFVIVFIIFLRHFHPSINSLNSSFVNFLPTSFSFSIVN